MKSFQMFGLVAMCAYLTGCGPVPEGGADKTIKIAVIPKGTTHEFWRSIEAGARKAEQELNANGVNVEVIWKGPLREDNRDQQMEVVENFTNPDIRGIVLAPLDDHALVSSVETAVEAGIPVVVIDSGLNSDKQTSFVSTDNYKGGVMAGEHMAKLLGGKGKIILLRYQEGSASTEKREKGFLDAIKEHAGITVLSEDQYAGPTRESGYKASENLLVKYGDQVDGIFCPCEPPTVAMAKALQDIGRAGGKVKMVGFDAGSQSVADLKNGNVQALVVQDPVKMGYLGVMTMIQHLNKEPVSKVIDTGVVLVTPENMNDPSVHELLYPPLEKYLK